jgi:hypothetical protein
MAVDPARLLELADEIDNRLGPIPWRKADELAGALRSAAEQIVDMLKDQQRLDFLDRVNQSTNERIGSRYGWKFDINHNRAALTDHNHPALTVREALDHALSNLMNGGLPLADPTGLIVAHTPAHVTATDARGHTYRLKKDGRWFYHAPRHYLWVPVHDDDVPDQIRAAVGEATKGPEQSA